MKVFQINSFGNLSTGRIAVDIYKTLKEAGYDGIIAYARGSLEEGIPGVRIGSHFDLIVHGLFARFLDRSGAFSMHATKKLLREIELYSPDIIHLHNLHGYYINIPILFKYLKDKDIPVVWTLHDCWAFTGHCCYYSVAGCNRWQQQCYNCPQKKIYPASLLFDNSRKNYLQKKELFTGVDLQIVVVSRWLGDEVRKSFLQNKRMTVIYNGIDTSVFKPTESNFKAKYCLQDKQIILGVASTWSERKGLLDFIKLSYLLNDQWRIVLVGVTDNEIGCFTSKMIGIKRLNCVSEVAEIYSAANVFFNASTEETFGMPTIEAMACGTPVVVYNATAIPEVVEEGCGFIVEPHDLPMVVRAIENIDKVQMSQKCIETAKKYDKKKRFAEYIDLYQHMV